MPIYENKLVNLIFGDFSMKKFILGLMVLSLFTGSLYANLTTAKNVKNISKKATIKLKKEILSDKNVKKLITNFLTYVDKRVKETAKIGYTYSVAVGLHNSENKDLFAILKPMEPLKKRFLIDLIIQKIRNKGYSVKIASAYQTKIIDISVGW